jgi:hypothetical protein
MIVSRGQPRADGRPFWLLIREITGLRPSATRALTENSDY